MKNLKLTSILFACLLFICQVITAFAAGNFDNHWASQALSTWQNYGIINVDENGNLNPDNTITRAEFATLLDNMMEYQVKAENNFVDLSNTWYTDAMLSANAAGIIKGYEDGYIKPNANITRQEAVVMFARLLDLDVDNAPTATYSDISSVSDWALSAVNAMTEKNYICGYNNILRPTDSITRAEVVTIINNIFASYIYDSGTYTKDIAGSAIISTENVTIKDTTISDDLIITEGVNTGHIELDNVTVNGRLIIHGGGENSVIIKGNSKIENVFVASQQGIVNISVQDNAKVSKILVDDNSDTVKIDGSVDTISIDSIDTSIEVTGTVGTILVSETANSSKLNIAKTATVENISIFANDVAVYVAGTAKNISVSGSNVSIYTIKGAKIDLVVTSGLNTSISGDGTVKNVKAIEGSTGTKVETNNTNIENNSSSDVTISDGSVIKPNENGNSSGSSNSGNSGGSSGGSSSSGGGDDGSGDGDDGSGDGDDGSGDGDDGSGDGDDGSGDGDDGSDDGDDGSGDGDDGSGNGDDGSGDGDDGSGDSNDGSDDGDNDNTTSATVNTLTQLETALNDTNIKTITINGDIKIGSAEIPTENFASSTLNVNKIAITKEITIPEDKNVTISQNAKMIIAPDGLLTSNGILTVDGSLYVYTSGNERTTLSDTTINGELNIYDEYCNDSSEANLECDTTTVNIVAGKTITVNGTVSGNIEGMIANKFSIDAIYDSLSKMVISSNATVNSLPNGTTYAWFAESDEPQIGDFETANQSGWFKCTQQSVNIRPEGAGKPDSEITDNFNYPAAYTAAGVDYSKLNTNYTFTVDLDKLYAMENGDENSKRDLEQLVQNGAMFVGLQMEHPSYDNIAYISVYQPERFELTRKFDYTLNTDYTENTNYNIVNGQYIYYMNAAYLDASVDMGVTQLGSNLITQLLIWKDTAGNIVEITYLTVESTNIPAKTAWISANTQLDKALNDTNITEINITTGFDIDNNVTINKPVTIYDDQKLTVGETGVLTICETISGGTIGGTSENSRLIVTEDNLYKNLTSGTYIWSDNEWKTAHIITFNLNYTNAPTASTQATNEEGKLTELPTPDERAGYEFKGWYTTEDGTSEDNKISTDTVFDADCIVYAKWELITSGVTLPSFDHWEELNDTSYILTGEVNTDDYIIPSNAHLIIDQSLTVNSNATLTISGTVTGTIKGTDTSSTIIISNGGSYGDNNTGSYFWNGTEWETSNSVTDENLYKNAQDTEIISVNLK